MNKKEPSLFEKMLTGGLIGYAIIIIGVSIFVGYSPEFIGKHVSYLVLVGLFLVGMKWSREREQ